MYENLLTIPRKVRVTVIAFFGFRRDFLIRGNFFLNFPDLGSFSDAEKMDEVVEKWSNLGVAEVVDSYVPLGPCRVAGGVWITALRAVWALRAH